MTKSFKHTICDVNVEVQELSVLHKHRDHRDVSETKLPDIFFFQTTANCPTLPFDSSTAKDPGTPLNANPELADLETIGSVFAGLLLSEVRSLIM